MALFFASLIMLLSGFCRAQATAPLRALLVAGSEALQAGDNVAAAKAFQQALALDPNSVEVLNDLAIALARQGKQAEAIALYERALKVEPGNRTTARNLAIAYFRAQHYRDAWPLLQRLSATSGDFQTLDLAGFTLFALDRYPQSANYLERANRLQPTDLATLDLLGKAYMRSGNYKAVPDVFARIMAVNPNSAAAHVMMGMADDNMFHDNDALAEYQAADKVNPRFPGVHSGLGQIYWREGKLDLAASEFRRELSYYPTDPVSNCLLGEILRKQNHPAEAVPHLQAAAAANPKYKEAFFEWGKCELVLDRPADAVAPLRSAIELDPNYIQAHYALGTALRKLGSSGEAAREMVLAEQIQARQRRDYTKKLNSGAQPR